MAASYVSRDMPSVLPRFGFTTCTPFASLLIQPGESLAYVKEQIGHGSIQITVDVYGHLVRGGNRAAVDRLDDAPLWKTSYGLVLPIRRAQEECRCRAPNVMLGPFGERALCGRLRRYESAK
jgi:hypothetical protein